MPGTDLLVALLVFLHFVVAGYDGLIHPAAFSILRVRFPDALLDFLLAVASKKRNSEPQSLGRCERCVPEHAGTGLSRTAKHWQVRQIMMALDDAANHCEFKPLHPPERCGCAAVIQERTPCTMADAKAVLFDNG